MKQVHTIVRYVLLLTLIVAPVRASSLQSPCTKGSALLKAPYIAQLRNYCGPACLASALNYWGSRTDQKTIGRSVFDACAHATNGADMLLYARLKGFSAYSWNSSLSDLKSKLNRGYPVIVLQDRTSTDDTGHYRIVTGYDDSTGVIRYNDPYDPKNTSMPYDKFDALWACHGHWALLICPPASDIFKSELSDRNAVVHIDLANAYMKRGNPELSKRESRKALAFDPDNYDMQLLSSKATRAMGAKSSGTRKAVRG